MKIASHGLRLAMYSILSIAGLILFRHSASALLIDDFTQGALVQQATNVNGLTVVQTGLNPTSTLGGTRSVYVGSLNLAEESIETAKGRFHFTANRDYGYFKLDWGSVIPLNANLTGGNNRLQLDFVDTSPNLSAAILQLRVKSANQWFDYDFDNDLASALNGQTFGSLFIPYTKFAGANFTEVQALEIYGARVPGGLHLVIDSISVVPEPSVVVLLGITPVLVWLRFRGFRRRLAMP